MATLRREIRIHAPASEVWKVVGRPEILHLWFPGLTNCTVDGNVRIIFLGSGMPMPEEIITNDSLQRRFQYRITVPIFKFHLATVDVIDLFDDTCLYVRVCPCVRAVCRTQLHGGLACLVPVLGFLRFPFFFTSSPFF